MMTVDLRMETNPIPEIKIHSLRLAEKVLKAAAVIQDHKINPETAN